MKNFLKHNIVYLILYVVGLCYVGSVLLQNGKIQIHKAMNAYVGNTYLDSFFKYITHLGDGAFAFLVAIILLFFNIRKSVYILLSYAGAGIGYIMMSLDRILYFSIMFEKI